MSVDLATYRVGCLSSLHCLPDYVSVSEEDACIANIAATKAGWKQVSGRKLLNYGGQISEKTGALLQVPLPGWLQQLAVQLSKDVENSGIGRINHVLVNSYEQEEGIFAHEDGPVYFPVACIISLGGPAIMRFFRKLPAGGHDPHSEASVILMPRSLLVFADDAYRHYLHGINQGRSELVDDSVVNAGQATYPLEFILN
ncbi:hypothetical protein WJX73_005012 [Symbiochloris irregularis]|uniref:Alpha-ketoglutarate-dependent dioxygenase AlkB-like domain-containing protein n=1 Tax=Symbiochloris irregularis TaxID=706552 RepID=A0AAW1NUT7_9CHLO